MKNKMLIIFLILLVLNVCIYYYIIHMNNSNINTSNNIYLDFNQLLEIQNDDSNIISELRKQINIEYINSDNTVSAIQFYVLPNKIDNVVYHTINYKNLYSKLSQPYQFIPLNSDISINFSFDTIPSLTLFQENNDTISIKTLYSRNSTYYIFAENSNKNIYIIKCQWDNGNSIDIVICVDVL